jgi:hypothetical protein
MLKVKKSDNLTMCPKCGHIGGAEPFNLPSVAKNVDGNSVSFEVLLPGHKEPTSLKKPPTDEELYEMTMEAVEKIQEEKLAALKSAKAPKKPATTPEGDK